MNWIPVIILMLQRTMHIHLFNSMGIATCIDSRFKTNSCLCLFSEFDMDAHYAHDNRKGRGVSQLYSYLPLLMLLFTVL